MLMSRAFHGAITRGIGPHPERRDADGNSNTDDPSCAHSRRSRRRALYIRAAFSRVLVARDHREQKILSVHTTANNAATDVQDNNAEPDVGEHRIEVPH